MSIITETIGSGRILTTLIISLPKNLVVLSTDQGHYYVLLQFGEKSRIPSLRILLIEALLDLDNYPQDVLIAIRKPFSLPPLHMILQVRFEGQVRSLVPQSHVVRLLRKSL